MVPVKPRDDTEFVADLGHQAQLTTIDVDNVFVTAHRHRS